ncbi:MAG: peptidase T [Clostridia bacterium]|nr:peptidase T [Clostridia bacterium]
MKQQVLDRFLQYVKIDTQSNPYSETLPSTEKQHALADLLYTQLVEMGASNVRKSKNCYVYAEIPATSTGKFNLGFIAHMDTAPDAPGDLQNPTVINNYDGKDIVLSQDTILSTKEFPSLLEHVGKTIVCADGRCLLGGDDKAGVAIIMTLAQRLLTHPEIEHGKISIAFTPDEEVGRGVEGFEVEAFNCDGAYTIDGVGVGQLEYENFNAAGVKIVVNGKSIHPGDAKDLMVNALSVAVELDSLLPKLERPQHTCGYEGFFHLTHLSGSVEKANVEYIIRDHDKEKFAKKKQQMREAVDSLNKKYGEKTVEATIKDSYFNMKEIILQHFHLVENAQKAFLSQGITPQTSPIRGGTDGATLSFKGLPCPNLSGCYYNAHGRYEYAVADDMAQMVDVCVELAKLYNI